MNSQPWKFSIIADQETKNLLAAASSFNGQKIQEASHKRWVAKGVQSDTIRYFTANVSLSKNLNLTAENRIYANFVS